MALSFLTAAIVIILTAAAIEWLSDYFNARHDFRQADHHYNTDYEFSLNETDKQMIDIQSELLKEYFPDGIPETMYRLSEQERIELFEELAEKLALSFGIGADILESISFVEDYRIDGSPLCGAYSPRNRSITLNQTFICVDLRNLQIRDKQTIDDIFIDSVDTLIHELRHAYQHHVCNLYESGENCERYDMNNRVEDWNVNRYDYVRCTESLEAYSNQPLECDSRNYTSSVISEYIRRVA